MSISRIIVNIEVLSIVLAFVFAVGRNRLLQKVKDNILGYVASQICEIVLSGKEIYWDDLLSLYAIKCKSLLGSKDILSCEQGKDILSMAKSFLSENFRSHSDSWQRLIRNAERSIPTIDVIEESGNSANHSRLMFLVLVLAPFREAMIFLPGGFLLWNYCISSKSFVVWDISFLGFVMVVLTQGALFLKTPFWVVVLLVITTFFPCLVFAVLYFRTVRLAFRIPKLKNPLGFIEPDL